MSQKKADKPSETKQPPPEGQTETPSKGVTAKGKELAEDMDALMDEIDDVLEKNAEEFVKSYVQKGGQ